jgi:hypothetical protein
MFDRALPIGWLSGSYRDQTKGYDQKGKLAEMPANFPKNCNSLDSSSRVWENAWVVLCSTSIRRRKACLVIVIHRQI